MLFENLSGVAEKHSKLSQFKSFMADRNICRLHFAADADQQCKV